MNDEKKKQKDKKEQRDEDEDKKTFDSREGKEVGQEEKNWRRFFFSLKYYRVARGEIPAHFSLLPSWKNDQQMPFNDHGVIAIIYNGFKWLRRVFWAGRKVAGS